MHDNRLAAVLPAAVYLLGPVLGAVSASARFDAAAASAECSIIMIGPHDDAGHSSDWVSRGHLWLLTSCVMEVARIGLRTIDCYGNCSDRCTDRRGREFEFHGCYREVKLGVIGGRSLNAFPFTAGNTRFRRNIPRLISTPPARTVTEPHPFRSWPWRTFRQRRSPGEKQ